MDTSAAAALLEALDSARPPWVVARTRRLARELKLGVASRRAAAGVAVAATPPVRALDEWIDDLGREALSAAAMQGGDASAGLPGRGPRLLLSPAAERILWEKAMAAASPELPREVLDAASLARSAAEAWRRIVLWGEPSWPAAASEDVAAFRAWLAAFRGLLADGGFITAAELPALVAEAIGRGEFDARLPEAAWVLGFEREDPALALLREALASRGVAVVAPPPATAKAEPLVLRAPDPAAELRAVASRIRTRLLAEPGLRVAVLAPDLATSAGRIERVLEEELDPGAVARGGAESGRRFDFAEAPSLADHSLVATALDLLALGDGPLDFHSVSRVLLSEWPRTGEDASACEQARTARAVLEARLRRSRAASLRLVGGQGGVAASVAAEARRQGLDGLASRLEALVRALRDERALRASPPAWRERWLARLHAAGWPGEIRGDAEGLVFRRWRDALDEFCRLEAVEPLMPAGRALALLREACAAMPVQPPSQGMPVQVMTMLDAAGLDFDLVHVVGLVSTAFPPAPRPNPFLPVAWQREQPGMPRASVEAERALAEAVWERVLASAPEVVASWSAAGEGDEEQSPSVVVARLEATDIGDDEGWPWWARVPEAATALVAGEDEARLVPLVRSGGSSVLGQQSTCPFKAFANTRLGVEPLARVQPQPDAAQRGNLVHDALHRAYRRIPDSNAMRGLSDDNLRELAGDVAAEAVAGAAMLFGDAADLAASVRTWLADLVAAWLLYEAHHRQGEWAVEELEKDATRPWPPGRADGLVLRFRPDRVDRVEGGLAVLDFKTSASAHEPGAWAGERPSDPQLPLYAALFQDEGRPVSALAFANLGARDECSLVGLAAGVLAEKCGPPSPRQKKFPQDFDATLSILRDRVEALATAYLDGDIRVDPRETKQCASCGCRALCRVHERPVADEDESGEDGE